jgi:hypothetical protein
MIAPMSLLLMERQPVPVHAGESHSLCEIRGHCGPFANEGFYTAFPEPMWHGMGDCIECGTTRKVAHEVAKALGFRSAA